MRVASGSMGRYCRKVTIGRRQMPIGGKKKKVAPGRTQQKCKRLGSNPLSASLSTAADSDASLQFSMNASLLAKGTASARALSRAHVYRRPKLRATTSQSDRFHTIAFTARIPSRKECRTIRWWCPQVSHVRTILGIGSSQNIANTG